MFYALSKMVYLDIPLMLDDQFLGMCFWDDAGNKNPLLGCNGARECKRDGSFWAVTTGYVSTILHLNSVLLATF